MKKFKKEITKVFAIMLSLFIVINIIPMNIFANEDSLSMVNEKGKANYDVTVLSNLIPDEGLGAVKALANDANTVNKRTAKTTMTDSEKIEEVSAIVRDIIEYFEYTTDTTADDVMDAIHAVLGDEFEGSVEWDEPYEFKNATTEKAGYVHCFVKVKLGDLERRVGASLTIPKLVTLLEEAVKLVSVAFDNGVYTNETTEAALLNTLQNSVSGVNGVTVEFVDGTFNWKPATAFFRGKIEVEIVLKRNADSVNVPLTKYFSGPVMSDEEILAEAIGIATPRLENFTCTNSTTADDVMQATGIAFPGVSVGWDADKPFEIIYATKYEYGLISGQINVKVGDATDTIVVNKRIAKLPITDEEMIEKAKTVAETAINDITVTNTKTTTDIIDSIKTALNSVTVIYNVAWDTNSPKVMYATIDKAGYLKGTIVMTVRGIDVKLNVDKVIAKLPNTDGNKVYTASAYVKDMLSVLKVSNSTKANNILALARESYQSVDGVYIAWKANSYAITPATIKNAGSIVGTLVLYCGNVTTEIKVNKTISKLTNNPSTSETPTISIISGSQNYKQNSKKDLIFKCTAKLEDLIAFYVDGKKLDSNDYTLVSGSTVLTLKASYLDRLASGKHTLKLVYKGNVEVTSVFTVEKTSTSDVTKPSTPKTGDTTNRNLFTSFIVLSGIALAYIGFKKRKTME